LFYQENIKQTLSNQKSTFEEQQEILKILQRVFGGEENLYDDYFEKVLDNQDEHGLSTLKSILEDPNLVWLLL
jgi:predicted solute-binding protein